MELFYYILSIMQQPNIGKEVKETLFPFSALFARRPKILRMAAVVR